jgi:phosphatidyl-myo-inositol dimannoside synthase
MSDERGKVLLSLCRLERRKGLEELLRAWGTVAPSFPEWRLVIAGTGRQRFRLRRSSVEFGAPRVDFVGYVSRSDRDALLRTSKAFVLPSVTRRAGFEVEGLGIGVVEARMSGLPCLVGRSGGVPETIDGCPLSRSVDAADPYALETTLQVFLEDAAKADHQAIHDAASKDWQWERFRADVERLASSAAAGRFSDDA